MWSPDKKEMVVSNEHSYNIFGGKEFNSKLICNSNIETFRWPYALKPKIDGEKQGAFFEGMKNFVTAMFKESMDKVKFVLNI